MTAAFFQMIAALAFVLLILAGFAFVAKKRQKAGGRVKILSYQSLGQKIGLAEVEIADEVLVLGVTPNDFKVLKKIDAPRAAVPQSRSSERVSKLKTMKESI